MTVAVETPLLPPEQVAAFIPQALRGAICAYRERSEKNTAGMNSKDFAEHQKTLTVTLAHIDMLLKVAARAGLPDADGDHDRRAETADLLRLAAEDVAMHEKSRRQSPQN